MYINLTQSNTTGMSNLKTAASLILRTAQKIPCILCNPVFTPLPCSHAHLNSLSGDRSVPRVLYSSNSFQYYSTIYA